MTNKKEILDIIDNIKINEDDFKDIDVELNDIEKKRIQKKYRNKIKSKKSMNFKKGLIACGLAVAFFAGGVAAMPVNASNIPVLNSIYESLGVYDEYKEYTTYIGESQKAGKYTYTIEEMAVSIHESLIAIKIESDEIIPENFNGFMTNIKIGGISWDSGIGQEHRIDDKTIVKTIENFYYDKISNKSDVKIVIYSIDESDNNNSTTAEFSFKANFEKSYSESYEKDINGLLFKDDALIQIDEINSSIFGTSIVTKSLALKDINTHDNFNLVYELRVDGKSYILEVTNSSLSNRYKIRKGRCILQVKELKVDTIKNAESISLLIYEENDQGLEDDENSITEKYLEENMTCIKEYKIK